MRLATQCAAVLLALTLFPAQQDPAAQDAWRAGVEAYREKRNASLRSDPFSPLALVHREYFDGRTSLTIGSDGGADVRLPAEGVSPMHATLIAADPAKIELEAGALATPVPAGSALVRGPTSFEVKRGFGIGRYTFLYRTDAPVRGAAIEVYDPKDPAITGFRGLEFFAPDARYRVQAELTPRAEPPQVQLIDSAGQPRPYFIYGDLRFTLNGTAVTMEVYSTTLDRAAIERGGFMLIFSDATSGADAASGKESYYAGRYLDIEGRPSGAVTVDFNLARNPPCAFSPVFTCPFPRAQNRLPVAIRAGEKTYRGKTATPLKK